MFVSYKWISEVAILDDEFNIEPLQPLVGRSRNEHQLDFLATWSVSPASVDEIQGCTTERHCSLPILRKPEEFDCPELLPRHHDRPRSIDGPTTNERRMRWTSDSLEGFDQCL